LSITVVMAHHNTWGDPSIKIPIIVNNKRFQLGQSAHQALSGATAGVNLWIDAICINQNDNDEKSQQVPLMADIYSLATATDIWLGPEMDDSALAIEFLLDLKEILPSISEVQRPDSVPLAIEVERKTAEVGGRKWAAVSKLLDRPWFSRVWVIQEAALSTGVVQFVCGNHGIPWQHFAEVLEHLHRLQSQTMICSIPPGGIDATTIGTFPTGWTQMRLIMVLANKKSSGALSLEDAIQFSQTCEATNPRDKIYGLYGLTNVKDPEILADYNHSVEFVYLQVTAYTMTQNESLRLLSDAGIAWEDRMQSLPTWVPNYHVSMRPSSRLGYPAENGYKAGGDRKVNFHWDSSSDDLIIRGVLIDTASKMTSLYPHHLKRPKLFMRDFFWEILELLDESQLDVEDPAVRECLWRTLLADRDDDSEKLPPKYGKLFDSFALYHTQLERFAGGFSWDELNPTADPARAEEITTVLEMFQYKEGTNESLVGRRFCITQSGHMGLVPGKTEVGDSVCVFTGNEVPFILRKAPSVRKRRQGFLLVGESYIHGLMDGEALGLAREREIAIQ
jgi:hypothetical protein